MSLDGGEGGGERRGVGVEQGADLGQWYTGGGQRPDLHQPQQVVRSVASIT
ncbi:hypothetical protein [Amycolatopsis sp. lyj-90]|uniref:hypothetical protein n=1 Tax=Amycolatopsis sp. lyj-90 TaxID=2789285 RepID=UPI00397A7BFF